MKDIFIKKQDLNENLAKHFKNDLISIDEILDKLDDLDTELRLCEEENDFLKSNSTNWNK